MGKYAIYKDKDTIDVFGYDQSFDEDDIKSLWEEHKIVYQKGGVMAVWIEERQDAKPLVHLMSEDDGHLFWKRILDKRFDAGWLDNYINTLAQAKEKIFGKDAAR